MINLRRDKLQIVRIGQGYDVHRLIEGRKLVLGGVCVPFELGLDGHSDADVLVHSIMDALLGSICEGDIGQLFPDTDEKFKGADSLKLLEIVGRKVFEKGFEISNIDATIICQRPKLAPLLGYMRENIASVLRISVQDVNIKATTTERLGFEGREEGISSMAVCLVKERAKLEFC